MPLESSAVDEKLSSCPVDPFHCVATKPDSPSGSPPACVTTAAHSASLSQSTVTGRPAMCEAIRLASSSSGVPCAGSDPGDAADAGIGAESPSAAAVKTTAALSTRARHGARRLPSRRNRQPNPLCVRPRTC